MSVQTKVSLTFVIDSAKPLTREYFRRVNRALREPCKGGFDLFELLYDAGYADDGTSKEDIIYIHVDDGDKNAKLEKVQ